MARKDIITSLLVAALVLFCQAVHVESSALIMKDLAKGFGAAAIECGKEISLNDDAINELYNFWNDKFTLTDRQVGCAIICMAKKHNVIGEDGKLHHENGAQFAMKHGADEATAKRLVQIIHECEGVHTAVEEECARVLEISKCFREECKKLNWMPDFQELVDEIMG